ncbi:MAG: hypothetical protein LBD60_04570, partial [Puniceicoccales bacterium]|nr:hypothetical protein [Puniceicoccales bacterium]
RRARPPKEVKESLTPCGGSRGAKPPLVTGTPEQIPLLLPLKLNDFDYYKRHGGNFAECDGGEIASAADD